MNTWLAEMFGTAPAAPAASTGQEKTAQLELFAKLAADEGIDLTTLSPQQVDALYRETFGKQAEEGESEESEEEEKVEEAAKEEHEEKKAQVAKLAEAELMGQVMAHSFVRELNDIEKNAAMPAGLSSALARGRGALGSAGKRIGEAASEGKRRVGAAAGAVRARTGAAAGAVKEKGRAGLEYAKTHKKQLAGAAGGAALLTGGGAAAGYAAGRKKEASAFELLAAQNAIKVAAAAGYDEDQALKLVESVYNLGLEESEKVAYVEDTSNAIHVRSLEYLEQAGYPVNWEEVFGS